MKKTIKVGSRDSFLAVAQTNLVLEQLKQCHPEIDWQLVTMKTTGDRILDRSLEKIGGKGLFVKELDRALQCGEIDLAIHSLKDIPMEVPEDLPILAYFQRGDPRDALVLPSHPSQAFPRMIGSSSSRRRIQLEQLWSGISVASVRGNIQTRLQKLDAGTYDALVLAAAGLQRAGLSYRISRYFSIDEILPAAGQGILAVQGRRDCLPLDLSCIHHLASAAAAQAEREFVRALQGGCTSPVSAYGQVAGQELRLTGLFYREEQKDFFRSSCSGPLEQARQLGESLAESMKKEAEKRP